MQAQEIADLIKEVADETNEYGNIRAGGNLGTAILAFAMIE